MYNTYSLSVNLLYPHVLLKLFQLARSYLCLSVLLHFLRLLKLSCLASISLLQNKFFTEIGKNIGVQCDSMTSHTEREHGILF